MIAPCAVAVMAKASAPGRTKTRLCPPLSFEDAAALNTVFLKDIAANVARAARETPMACYMAYGPPGSEDFFRRELAGDIGLVPAWYGDFGACLRNTATALLEKGHQAVCLLNADSPTLPTTCLTGMARALAAPGDRGVIGPAEDGGYYLLGLKAAHARLFEEIDWSTERVFGQTCERAREIGLPLSVLAPWYDVDDAAGLARLGRDLFEAPPPGALSPSPAEHTRPLLRTLLKADTLA